MKALLIIFWQIKAVFLSCICSHENLCDAQAPGFTFPRQLANTVLNCSGEPGIAFGNGQSCMVRMELHDVAVGFISSTLMGRKPQPLMQHQMIPLLETECFCKLLELPGRCFSAQALMLMLGHSYVWDAAGLGKAGCLSTGLGGS